MKRDQAPGEDETPGNYHPPENCHVGRAAWDRRNHSARNGQDEGDYQAQAEAVRGPDPVRHAVAHFSLILVNCDADPVEAHVDARKEVP